MGKPGRADQVLDSVAYVSSFLRGLDWGLGEGIKIFTFQTNFSEEVPDSLYETVNNAMEENDAVIFWAQPNGFSQESYEDRDQPYIFWSGSTRKNGTASNYSASDSILDARAPTGNRISYNTSDPDDSTQVLTGHDGQTYETGNSLAAPFMAGMAATLWDALPAGLSDQQRRDKVIDILERTSTYIGVTGDWGQVNILNAFGRAPSSASVTTGTGSITLSSLWREEGTGITVSSDEGVGGTVRVIFESVHPSPFDDEDAGGFDVRVRLTGPSGNATVKLKRNNGTYDTIGTVPVSGTATASEVSFFNVLGPAPNTADYINGSGNITVRIEVAGQIGAQYDAVFDQILVRTLRYLETQ